MTSPQPRHHIAVAPDTEPDMHAAFVAAVDDAGGTVVPLAEASALVWADPAAAAQFPSIIGEARSVEWVQLPYAGIETFTEHLRPGIVWTCGKGTYAEPVAEHVVALALAGLRDLHTFVPATSWPERTGRNLLGARVLILGGGGIAEHLVRLLQPFRCDITVARRSKTPFPGADATIGVAQIPQTLPNIDVVVVAWALTDETRGFIDAPFLSALNESAWIINVGRGAHIVTDDLVAALADGSIAGAALDVTDPEPLPDGHPLWKLPNCIITPHVGNTAEMGRPLIAGRVRDNVAKWIANEELDGLVDIDRGY